MNLLPLITTAFNFLPQVIDAIFPDKHNDERDLVVAFIELILSGETNYADITEMLNEVFGHVNCWRNLSSSQQDELISAIATIASFIISLSEAPSPRKRINRKKKRGKKKRTSL